MIELLLSILGDGEGGEAEGRRSAKAVLSVAVVVVLLGVLLGALIFGS